MSKTDEIQALANQRNEDRIRVPGLKASIRQQGAVLTMKPKSCTILDINRSGISIECSTLFLTELQQVVIYLTYHGHYYRTRGVIVYRTAKDGSMYYGVMFVHVPYQLDQLLTQWISLPYTKAPSARNQTTVSISSDNLVQDGLTKTQLVKGTQRRVETRFSAADVTTRIRKGHKLALSRYVTCQAIDISRGGLSCITQHFKPQLMGKVRIEFTFIEQVYNVDGVILYYKASAEGFHIGVEFFHIPPKLIRVLDQFHKKQKK